MATPQQVGWADVQGILRGQHYDQVLIDQYIVNIGAVQGGAVNIAPQKERAEARIRLRREPPYILPRSVPGFLDRNREQGLVGQALARDQVVNIHGPEGAGKTALAGRVMQTQLPGSFPDGLVYLSARHETHEDLLQALFHSFFESDELVKVTENDVRRLMAGKRALIVVDDADLLGDKEVEALAQVVPQCALLIAGQQQQIWQGASVLLRGMPRQHAVALFEQHFRPGVVAAAERSTVEAICDALGGIPLNIVKIATIASQQGLSLDQVLQQIRPEEEKRDPLALALALISKQLSEGQRLVLGGLAAGGGSSVGLEALPVITGLPLDEIAHHLRLLQQIGLVEVDGLRWRLSAGLGPTVQQAWASDEMQARAAEYYASRVSALQHLPRDADEENVLSALDHYFQQGQWQRVVTIARSLDRYLAATGHWAQWRRRLDQAQQAARKLGDRATEAWAQHQLGVIALGLGDTDLAKQLFRSALSLRRGLGDRAGAMVTRWNLRLTAPPPPPPPAPRNGPLDTITSGVQSAGFWLPVALVTVALLVAMAAIPVVGSTPTPMPLPPAATLAPTSTPPQPTATFTPERTATFRPEPTVTFTPEPTTPLPTVTRPVPPPPRPALDVWLPEGCGYSYEPGEQTRISVQASLAGQVDIYLVVAGRTGHHLFGQAVRAGQVGGHSWHTPEKAGRYSLLAVLNDGQAREYCGFEVVAPAEIEIPTPEIRVWPVEGCGASLPGGVTTTLSIWANVDGQAEVWLWCREEKLFNGPLQAGQVESWSWLVPQQLWEGCELEATLNDGRAYDTCDITVEETDTHTVTVEPTPEVEIQWVEGCDQAYEPSAASQVQLWANVTGQLNVYLVNQEEKRYFLFSKDVQAEQFAYQDWSIPETEGAWFLEAQLEGTETRGYCEFRVQSTPEPTVWVDIAGGCGEAWYEPGAWAPISFGADVTGWVTILVDGEERFSRVVKGNVPYQDDIEVGDEGGWHQLTAILGKWQDTAECLFGVEQGKPGPEQGPTLAPPTAVVSITVTAVPTYEVPAPTWTPTAEPPASSPTPIPTPTPTPKPMPTLTPTAEAPTPSPTPTPTAAPPTPAPTVTPTVVLPASSSIPMPTPAYDEFVRGCEKRWS
jgi:hypothetical protein